MTIETDNSTKEKIIKGIDDAVYGLMMMMDGVTGSLRNKEYAVSTRLASSDLIAKNTHLGFFLLLS